MRKQLTREQRMALVALRRAYRKGMIPTLGGLGGTGKTQVAVGIPKAFGIPAARVLYIAPTHSALKVVRDRLRENNVDSLTTTAHKYSCRQPIDLHCAKCPIERDGECHRRRGCGCRLVFPGKASGSIFDLVVCEEASMVGYTLYHRIIEMGSPVVFIGDHGQLRPVPQEGEPADFCAVAENKLTARLETPHRTVADSDIVRVSRAARVGGSVAIDTENSPVQIMSSGYLQHPTTGPGHMFLAHQNRTVARINDQERKSLGYEDDLEKGDRVSCMQTVPDQGVFNGLMGTVLEARQFGDGHLWATIDLDGEGRTWSGYVRLYAARGITRNHPPSPVGRDLSRVVSWMYAHAMTVHRAQGSEWPRVTIIDDYERDKYFRNWMYTAITRASESVTILGNRLRYQDSV